MTRRTCTVDGCPALAGYADRLCSRHHKRRVDRGDPTVTLDKRLQRGLTLTDKGMAAIGVSPQRSVPLVAVAWRDDRRDLR